MTTPENLDDLPKEELEELIEEELEKVEDDIEDIAKVTEVLGKPTLPLDYDPAHTRRVLRLSVDDPINLAWALAEEQGAGDKFNELLDVGDYRTGHNLARIVDDAVLAETAEEKPNLWQRAKAWYHRLGPRFKYNAEMIFGSILEYPGAALGGLFGGAIFGKMESPQWFKDACDYVANQNIWYLSGVADDLDFSDATVTLVSMIAAGAAYWTGALYLRNRDQKSVYEKYPEIKKKDTWRFVGFGLFVGLFGTAIRAYATYKMNEVGAGGALSALAGTVPSQAFAFTVMNIYGTYAGLVRDEEKLEQTIIKVKEKRGELPKLETKIETAKTDDYSPS